jgi:hypothetical protein
MGGQEKKKKKVKGSPVNQCNHAVINGPAFSSLK